MKKWKEILKEENVEFNDNYIEVLFDSFEVELVKNYTKENFLNSIVMLKAPGVPYLLDANRLLLSFLKQNYQTLRILKYNQENYKQNFESAIQTGVPVLLEYTERTLDASLVDIINSVSEQNRTITINGTEIEYSPNFKLFIMNTQTHPDIAQEVYINCPVINFDINNGHMYQQLWRQFQDTVQPEQKYKHHQAISDLMANRVRLQKK